MKNKKIKFRAWDKDHMENNVCACYGNLDKNQIILMQFTGLYDKNGTEIYEGDIMNDKGIIFEVYWNNHNGNWARKNISELLAGKTMKISEVIGNIYENNEK